MERLRSFGLYVAGFASLFLIWHIASTWIIPSVLFPTPWMVLLKGIELAQDGTLWEQVSASLGRIAAGFAGGSLIGIPVGLFMGRIATLRDLLLPVLNLIRPISPVALVPLVIVWFGIGETAKITLGDLAGMSANKR